MSEFDKEWVRVVRNILDNGMNQKKTKSKYISDDKPAPTRYVIGEQMRFSGKEMPMLFSKELYVRLAFEEMKKILIDKSTVVQDFRDVGINFWDKWEYPDGDMKGTMGKAYAYQVKTKKVPVPLNEINPLLLSKRNQEVYKELRYAYEKGVVLFEKGRRYTMLLDQVDVLVQKLARAKEHGIGRNNIITILDQSDVPFMAIFPCVWAHKYYVDELNRLHIILDIRSNDIALGNSFNIPQYFIWYNLLAHVTGLEVGEMIVSIGDAHLYNRHIDNATQMMDTIESGIYDDKKATLTINPDVKSIYDVTWKDIKIEGYEKGPKYEFDLAYTISPINGK